MKEKVSHFSLKVDYDRLSEFEWQLECYSTRQMFKIFIVTHRYYSKLRLSGRIHFLGKRLS